MTSETLHQTFRVTTPARVSLSNVSGQIDVQPGEAEMVTVTAVKHVDTGDAGDLYLRVPADTHCQLALQTTSGSIITSNGTTSTCKRPTPRPICASGNCPSRLRGWQMAFRQSSPSCSPGLDGGSRRTPRMAYYLVKAHLKPELRPTLRERLNSGEIRRMRPFGLALHDGLDNARVEDGWVIWEEEDYCRPPLAMERAAVLDTYFVDLDVETVERGAGWTRIESLPHLWRTSA